MSAVNDVIGPGHIPYLLDLAHRRMQQDLADLVDSASFPELRGSHFRILSMIPGEGARPSELAAVAQITRPALGEIVRHLEEHDYVLTTADPSDGRAVIVLPTERGRAAATTARRAITTLRRNWAREIGKPAMESLLDALAALTLDREEA